MSQYTPAQSHAPSKSTSNLPYHHISVVTARPSPLSPFRSASGPLSPTTPGTSNTPTLLPSNAGPSTGSSSSSSCPPSPFSPDSDSPSFSSIIFDIHRDLFFPPYSPAPSAGVGVGVGFGSRSGSGSFALRPDSCVSTSSHELVDVLHCFQEPRTHSTLHNLSGPHRRNSNGFSGRKSYSQRPFSIGPVEPNGDTPNFIVAADSCVLPAADAAYLATSLASRTGSTRSIMTATANGSTSTATTPISTSTSTPNSGFRRSRAISEGAYLRKRDSNMPNMRRPSSPFPFSAPMSPPPPLPLSLLVTPRRIAATPAIPINPLDDVKSDTDVEPALAAAGDAFAETMGEEDVGGADADADAANHDDDAQRSPEIEWTGTDADRRNGMAISSPDWRKSVYLPWVRRTFSGPAAAASASASDPTIAGVAHVTTLSALDTSVASVASAASATSAASRVSRTSTMSTGSEASGASGGSGYTMFTTCSYASGSTAMTSMTDGSSGRGGGERSLSQKDQNNESRAPNLTVKVVVDSVDGPSSNAIARHMPIPTFTHILEPPPASPGLPGALYTRGYASSSSGSSEGSDSELSMDDEAEVESDKRLGSSRIVPSIVHSDIDAFLSSSTCTATFTAASSTSSLLRSSIPGTLDEELEPPLSRSNAVRSGSSIRLPSRRPTALNLHSAHMLRERSMTTSAVMTSTNGLLSPVAASTIGGGHLGGVGAGGAAAGVGTASSSSAAAASAEVPIRRSLSSRVSQYFAKAKPSTRRATSASESKAQAQPQILKPSQLKVSF